MQESAQEVAPAVSVRGAVEGPRVPTGVAADAAAALATDRAAEPSRLDPALLVNRELSLLAFQWRVFEEARDPANPLLERVRFLSIVASNLDEFFMVRVAGLEQQVLGGVGERSPDGLTPAQQLGELRREALRLQRAMSTFWQGELRPAVDAAGIHVLDHPQLDARQLASAQAYFDELVMPVLTPLAFDPGRPFPHISNLSLNLAIVIEDGGVERFARVKVPGSLPRFVPLGRAAEATGAGRRSHSFVWLEQLIAAHADRLFPGVKVKGVYPFHVTRDAELEIQELEAADLLASVEHGVRERRFGSVVRLVVTPSMPDAIRELLVENLELDPRDVVSVEGPLALEGLAALTGVDRPDLKFPPFVPVVPARLAGSEDDLFDAIRRQDILLHHPFDSFQPVVELLRAAARDPGVLAIKMTLYRVGRNSPVVDALLEASQNRKQVAVLVELKARFDEESNIGWARALEAEGVHVIYGLLGLKTHSKIALVVRREGERLARYVHLSTGNYNAGTALAYTDLGLFTADPEVGEDATQLFNYLTGYAHPREFRRLLVAPVNLRERLVELVEREAAHARAGRGGHLVFKMNALSDERMIEAIVRAAQAGVQVDLLVRGICALRPGVPGVTDRVRVRSVLGRFLEHSRIFWFRNGGAEEVYVGSADLMRRNLSRRVEVLFPIRDPALVRHLRDVVLETYLSDETGSRIMRTDGGYERVRPRGDGALDAQQRLLQAAAAAADEAES